MNNRIARCAAALAVSASLAAVAGAQTAAFDVKLGLWDISSEMYGMPGLDTSHMTPEQTAQIQAAMSAMSASSQPRKFCLTKDKLEKATFELLTAQPGKSRCSQKLTSNTAAAVDGTIECGRGTAPNSFHIEVVSPTSIKGTMESDQSMRGRSMTTKLNVTGTWVGDDCGKIK